MCGIEGSLIALVQGRKGVDYDIGVYAKGLREVLERKQAMTAALLEKLDTFQAHLAIEEEMSKKIDAHTLRKML